MKICALMRQTWVESAQAHLSDLERLAFYEACFAYEFTGEIPTAKTCKYSTVLLLFDMVKGDLQADREKAVKRAETSAANGAMGGRPRKDYTKQHNNENPVGFAETQRDTVGLNSSALHYTTQQNTTTQQAAMGGSGVLDVEFFDAQIWPRINRSGKFNTRHRACIAKWEEYSSLKRQAIAKAVMADIFAGCDNPYYYLEDFQEPTPTNWNGRRDMPKGEMFVSAQFGGSWGTYLLQEAKAFGLETKGEPYVIP